MRARTLLLLPLVALLPVLAACSRGSTTATGPATSETSPASSTPGTRVSAGTTPPKTAPAGQETTTTVFATSTTKAPPTTKPKATSTTKAPTPGAPTTAAQAVKAPQQYCDWARSLLIEDKSVSFQQYMQNRYDATIAVGAVMPSELARDYEVIIAAAEKLKPAIDSGEVTSALGATQWYAKNDPALYDQLVAAVQHVGAYRKAHC